MTDLPPATPGALRNWIEFDDIAWVGDEDGGYRMEPAAFWAELERLDPEEVLARGIVVMLKNESWLVTDWGADGFGWYIRSVPEPGSEELRYLSGGGHLLDRQEQRQTPIADLKQHIERIGQTDDAARRREELLQLRKRVEPAEGATDPDPLWADNRETLQLAQRVLDLHIAAADESARGSLSFEDTIGPLGSLRASFEQRRRQLCREDYEAWLLESRGRAIEEMTSGSLDANWGAHWLDAFDQELSAEGFDVPDRPAPSAPRLRSLS